MFEQNKRVTEPRRRLFETIRSTPHLDWLLLTKRPENIQAMLSSEWADGWDNVWLGTSVENNDYVRRADHLRKIPAAVRFISYEPALGPLDALDLSGIDWMIVGGESGSGFRPFDHQRARDPHARCAAANVAFFFKQSAAYRSEMGTLLDGETVQEYLIPG